MSDDIRIYGCGFGQRHAQMLKRRDARILAGNAKLLELANAVKNATVAYDAFHRATRSEQNHLADPLAWLHASASYVALQSAQKSLDDYEKELERADGQRVKEIEKKLKALKADAAENGLSEEANAEMDKLEAELTQLEFSWL